MFKIQLKFLWRHPETNTLLEILSIAWKDSAPVIQIEIHSLRPHQPGHWLIPVETDSQEAAALAQSLKEYRQIAYLNHIHPLTLFLLNKLIDFIDSRKKTNPLPVCNSSVTITAKSSQMVEVSLFQILFIGTLFLTVVRLLL